MNAALDAFSMAAGAMCTKVTLPYVQRFHFQPLDLCERRKQQQHKHKFNRSKDCLTNECRRNWGKWFSFMHQAADITLWFWDVRWMIILRENTNYHSIGMWSFWDPIYMSAQIRHNWILVDPTIDAQWISQVNCERFEEKLWRGAAPIHTKITALNSV